MKRWSVLFLALALWALAGCGGPAADEAAAEKEAIRARLASLRSGEFGQKRADAKAQILNYYHQGGKQ